ncbi:MAG: alkaline phosphatase family protein, partial [Anaerolineales bacterium]
SNVMPYLNQLRDKGASALMHSQPPSYSEPGYSTILTGAWPDINDGPALNLDYAEIPTLTQDEIYSAAHRAGLETAISAFNWFEKLIPQEAVSASFYTAGEDKIADRQVTDAALPWLEQGKYQLVLIHLDQVDYAGHHEGGPIDPRWDAAATRADGLLKEIATAMDLTQDTLLVISDHGQIDHGGHGGQDAITLMEPFVLVGKGVIPGKYGNVEIVDVAPTIAAILGTNIPATSQGHSQIAMFDFSLSQVGQINSALAAQQDQLVQAYQTAINHPVTVTVSEDIVSASQNAMDSARQAILDNQRLPRGIIAIVLVLLFINLAAWSARPNFGWMVLGVLVYLVVFNIKYVFFDQKTYSLSSVIDADNLITSTTFDTLIALFVGWLLVLLGIKIYSMRPRKAAIATMKFILTTLSILSIPVFVHYMINGAIVSCTLPNFLFSFLGLIFLIQILMVAAIGIFFTGLAALVGLFGYGR